MFIIGAVNLSDHLDRSEADVRGVVIKGEVIEVTDDHHHAAIKLQTVQRSKNAKKQVEALREVIFYLFIYIYLSFYPSIHLSFYPSIYLSIFIYL